MKVYCEHCKYYGTFSFDGIAWDDKCKFIIGYVDTYRQRTPIRKKPSELNKNNNCPYYKPKLSIRILSKLGLIKKL